MKDFKKTVGNYGEDLCCIYLRNSNYIIKQRNFKKKNGEIDIIAVKDDILAFIEVKTRISSAFCNPLECINYKKQLTIKKIASYYIYVNNLYDYFIRYDACTILLNKYNNNYSLEYLKDAFR